MIDQDKGLLALAELQVGILALRAHYGENQMPDPRWVESEWAPSMAESLKNLDFYLTGKTENRRELHDVRQLSAMALDLKIYHVHLSDMGYSRLTLSPEAGKPVKIDRELSLARVLERWSSIQA